MPKLGCSCGYVHDLCPIPDEGFIVIKDKDYEELIRLECLREKLNGVKQGSAEWDKLIEADIKVSDFIERLYECPECGQVIWARNTMENYLYRLENKVNSKY